MPRNRGSERLEEPRERDEPGERPAVCWFSNPHDHSLHWIKLGLMRLEQAGQLHLLDIPVRDSGSRLPERWRAYEYRRLVAVTVRLGDRERLLLLDGEDSIFQISPLVEDCDLYFICAYNGAFFGGSPFSMALSWQTSQERSHYENLYSALQKRYKSHLHKGRPLGPIGPSVESAPELTWLRRKVLNLQHRVRTLRSAELDLSGQFARFEGRMAQLALLRQRLPAKDVVLKDTLWGWPRHRMDLHERLAFLSEEFDISAVLNWREPEPFELGGEPRPDPARFPMACGRPLTEDYEASLAASRLGVFATGFHYGCRNIVTLAWYFGLRTYLDPLGFETGADLSGLEIAYNTDGSWGGLGGELEAAKADTQADRQRRQAWFDQELSPDRLAERMLTMTIEDMEDLR